MLCGWSPHLDEGHLSPGAADVQNSGSDAIHHLWMGRIAAHFLNYERAAAYEFATACCSSAISSSSA